MAPAEILATRAYNSMGTPTAAVDSVRVDCRRRTSAIRKQVMIRCSALRDGNCRRFTIGSSADGLRTKGLNIGEGVRGIAAVDEGEVAESSDSDGDTGVPLERLIGLIL